MAKHVHEVIISGSRLKFGSYNKSMATLKLAINIAAAARLLPKHGSGRHVYIYMHARAHAYMHACMHLINHMHICMHVCI